MDDEKIKVLLLVVRTKISYRLFEEIGVCCLAAYLRQNGYEVMLMEENEDSIDYERIKSFDPGLIGMPVYISTEHAVKRVSSQMKERMPNVLLCLGGCSPTYQGARILKEMPDVHFIIRGEGEQVLLELANRLSSGTSMDGLKGLIYRWEDTIVDNGEQELIKDLDTLPWPSRDLLVEKNYNVALISTSRGCTGKCSFCVTKQFWKKWRGRNTKDVVNEMEYITKEYNIKSFYFIDCSFENPGTSYERVKSIAEEIINKNLNITYIAFIRPDFHRKADTALMELLRKSGMIGALIGAESANQHSLNIYNKHTTPEDNEKVITLFREYGINVEIGFIMFNPYSTFEGIRQDLNFLANYGFAYIISNISSQYAMAKGCALYEKIKADGLLADEDDVYGYRFVDERIEKLAGYARSFTDHISLETNIAFLRIHKSIINLAYWKKIFAGDKSIYNAIVEAEVYYNEVRDELNSRVYKWFGKLIELAENNWDEKNADAISEEILCTNFITGVYRNMEHKKNILHVKLSRRGYDIRKIPYVENT